MLYVPQSILQPNTKLLIQFPNSDTSIIRNHSHESLAHISNIVVIMQQLDMSLYCLSSGLSRGTTVSNFFFHIESRGWDVEGIRGCKGTYFKSFVTSSSFIRLLAISASNPEMRFWMDACMNKCMKSVQSHVEVERGKAEVEPVMGVEGGLCRGSQKTKRGEPKLSCEGGGEGREAELGNISEGLTIFIAFSSATNTSLLLDASGAVNDADGDSFLFVLKDALLAGSGEEDGTLIA
jgi:hypothetical protein